MICHADRTMPSAIVAQASVLLVRSIVFARASSPIRPAMSSSPSLSPELTKEDSLPPWEVAKAYAFAVAIEKIEEVLDEKAHVLLGQSKTSFIADQVTLKRGDHPTEMAVQKVIAKCRDRSWYPGKMADNLGGRPPTYSEHV